MRALSNSKYNYYELLQDFGFLEKGAIFYHDKNDNMYGSVAEGCLKLCWTPNGNCYSGLCGDTIFLHYNFAKDKDVFRKLEPPNKPSRVDNNINWEYLIVALNFRIKELEDREMFGRELEIAKKELRKVLIQQQNSNK